MGGSKPSKRIFLASDLHLGAPDMESSLVREKHFVKWLDTIIDVASDLYLVGDIFDFWFEYKQVVPKGFIRFQGKLAELADRGIQLHIFTGNHDLWYTNYFAEQLGAIIYKKPIFVNLHGKRFYLGHGDGLGPGDYGYKFIKRIFTNPVCKWLFHRLHPNFGIGLASYLSKTSRKQTGHKDAIFHGDKEILYIHSREILSEQTDIQFFVYGHRHIMKDTELEKGVRCIYLGDWIQHFSYLEVTENTVTLKTFPLNKR